MPVKIAHLNIVWRPSVGVLEKVRAIGEAAASLDGRPIDVLLCVPEYVRSRCGPLGGVRVLPVPAPAPRRVSVPLMSAVVWRYLLPAAIEYDAVVVRWTTPSPLFLRFARRVPVFTEHHTMEVPELESKRGLMNRALELLERRYSPRILASVRGIIAVTGEIRDYESARARRSLPSLVLPNGVSAADYQQVVRCRPAPGRVSVAFVSSRFAAWQGLDRLIAGLRAWQGRKPAVELHVVGELNAAQQRELLGLSFAGEVRLHGVLDKHGLAGVLSRCAVGMGSLAVHRKALREACALKVREYIASGLPVAIAYSDPDLPRDLPWVHRIPADDSPVSIAGLVGFARDVWERPGLSEEIRRFAVDRLDWTVKLGHMARFVATQTRHPAQHAGKRRA
jgi:glycosyltransferase involved in cell wall biosynthesis